MNLSDYLLSQDGHDWSSLLSDWTDVLPREFTIWMVNRLGDLVVVVPDGSVHWLEVGIGSLKRLADNRERFVTAIDEGDNASQWLAVPLVDACVASGMSLEADQCYGFKVPPMLGGAYESCSPLRSAGANSAANQGPSGWHPDQIHDKPVTANPSIERTVSSGLRPLPTAAHVKR
jgi:hypothetical protein